MGLKEKRFKADAQFGVAQVIFEREMPERSSSIRSSTNLKSLFKLEFIPDKIKNPSENFTPTFHLKEIPNGKIFPHHNSVSPTHCALSGDSLESALSNIRQTQPIHKFFL